MEVPRKPAIEPPRELGTPEVHHHLHFHGLTAEQIAAIAGLAWAVVSASAWHEGWRLIGTFAGDDRGTGDDPGLTLYPELAG